MADEEQMLDDEPITERERVIANIHWQLSDRLLEGEDIDTLKQEISERYPEYADELVPALEMSKVLIDARKESGGTIDEESLEEDATFARLKQQLEGILATLTPRESQVLRLRFGLEDGRPRTLEQVGQAMGLSRETVRRIEAKALRNLRAPSRAMALKDFIEEGGDESHQP